MNIVVFFFTLLVSLSLAETYGDLAGKYIPSRYATTISGMHSLNGRSRPGELGILRKSIIATRSFLDIFVYAYPKVNDVDIFHVLRKDLNRLYTDIGNFDDLSHVNYSSQEAHKLLATCLNDKHTFEENSVKLDYKSYIMAYDRLTINIRNKSKLSIDFWGGVPYVPEENYTAMKNLAMLAKGQLLVLLNTYDWFIKLTDIYNTQIHEEFHNYRKLIRGFDFVGWSFPHVFNISISLITINEAYSNIGKINDLINEYIYYTSRDKVKAERIKREIDTSWNHLKTWFVHVNLRGTLQHAYNHLI